MVPRLNYFDWNTARIATALLLGHDGVDLMVVASMCLLVEFSTSNNTVESNNVSPYMRLNLPCFLHLTAGRR